MASKKKISFESGKPLQQQHLDFLTKVQGAKTTGIRIGENNFNVDQTLTATDAKTLSDVASSHVSDPDSDWFKGDGSCPAGCISYQGADGQLWCLAGNKTS